VNPAEEVDPISTFKNLCDFTQIPLEYTYHQKADHFQCVVHVIDKEFTSSWQSNKKNAQKDILRKILKQLPIKGCPDMTPQKYGLYYYYSLLLADPCNGMQVVVHSDYFFKAEQAKRDLMKKYLVYYLDSEVKLSIEDDSPLSLTFPDISDKVKESICLWQEKYLHTVKSKLGLDANDNANNLDNLLTLAFVSTSFAYNVTIKTELQKCLNVNMTDYERLEMLGDSILGYLAALMVFEKFPQYDPGELTKEKQQLVSKEACYKFMENLGFDKLIIMRDAFQSPSKKVIADVFEAIIAALHIAKGHSSFEIVNKLIQ